MQAKDTILKSSLNADGSVHYPTMEEQAEITWDIAFKAGIKEVVESVNLMLKLPRITVDNIRLLWQAKLKEWGL